MSTDEIAEGLWLDLQLDNPKHEQIARIKAGIEKAITQNNLAWGERIGEKDNQLRAYNLAWSRGANANQINEIKVTLVKVHRGIPLLRAPWVELLVEADNGDVLAFNRVYERDAVQIGGSEVAPL